MSTYNQINGSFYQVANADANLTITEINAPNLNVSGQSNLGPVANVEITGGSNGQYLQTDGNGNLSWSTVDTSSINNGNSNVKIATANGNVTVSVGGIQEILTVSNTGVSVAGALEVTATSNLGNVGNVKIAGGTSGQVISTDGNGNLSFISVSSGSISNGTSNVSIPVASGNVNISAAGNANVVVVTGTGANITGTLNTTGNVSVPNLLVNERLVANAVTVSSNGNLLVSGISTLQGNVTANTNLTVLGNANVNGDLVATNANITGSANITGNVSAGNVSATTGTLTTGNITTVNTGLVQNGNSNIAITANGNLNFTAGGTSNVLRVSNSGVNVAGTLTTNGTLNATTLNVSGAVSFNANTFADTNIFLGNISFIRMEGGSEGQVLTKGANNNVTFSNPYSWVKGGLFTGAVPTVFNESNAYILWGYTDTISQIGGTPQYRLKVNTSNLQFFRTDFTNTNTYFSVSNSSFNIYNDLISNGNVNFSTSPLVTTGNLTSNGTVNFTTSANVTLGSNSNVKITGGSNGQYLQTDGTGNLSWSTVAQADATQIVNGNSNVVASANGNVTVSVAGNANIITVTGSGANVQGTLSVSSNISGGNVSAGNITATGAVSGTTLSGSLTTAAQPNVTSVGTLVGLVMSGNINAGNNHVTNLASPVNSTDAATKQYVDTVAEGLHVHAAVFAATTDTLANITGGTITYDNGTDGVGATLTTTGAYLDIDSVAIDNANTRILVKNEANATHNGIYVYTSETVITRATDFNTATEMAGGDFFFVDEGATYADTGWVLADPVSIVGTSDVNFVQFSGAGDYTAGTGLELNGSVFSIANTAVTAGSYGNGDSIATFSVNGQGQLTAAANTPVTANAANLTGNTLNSSVVTSNLTSLGNLTGLRVASGNADFGGANFVYVAYANKLLLPGGSNGQVLKYNSSNVLAGNVTWANNDSLAGNGVSLDFDTGGNVFFRYLSNLTFVIRSNSSVAVSNPFLEAGNLQLSGKAVIGNIYKQGNGQLMYANIQENRITFGYDNQFGQQQNYLRMDNTISSTLVDSTYFITTGQRTQIAGNLYAPGNIWASNIFSINTACGFPAAGNAGFFFFNSGANIGINAENTANVIFITSSNTTITNSNVTLTSGNLVLSNGDITLSNSSRKITGTLQGNIIGTADPANISITTANTYGINGNSLGMTFDLSNAAANGNMSIEKTGDNKVLMSVPYIQTSDIFTPTGQTATDLKLRATSSFNSVKIQIFTSDILTVSNTAITANANLVSNRDVSFTGSNISLGNNSSVKITGGSAGQYLQTDGAGNLTWASISTSSVSNGTSNVNIATANGNVDVVVAGNTILTASTTGANINGELAVTGNISGTDANINGNLLVSGQSNLGNVGNVVVTGGSDGQYLRTDGNGNLTWSTVTATATSVSNGNSNISFAAANGNIIMSVAGNANVVTVTGTGMEVTGTLNATGNVGTGNLTASGTLLVTGNANIVGNLETSNISSNGNVSANGTITATGNISGANFVGTLANGTSNVRIATANGNVTLASAGNTTLTVTGTGANIVGTLNADGNVTFTGANVSLGNIANVHIGGGANGQIITTDGNGNITFENSTFMPSMYLYARRSNNQTIPSGNWSSRDIVFNSVVESKNFTYNNSTGLFTLQAGVTYKITCQLTFSAAAAYFYSFGLFTEANVLVSQSFETFSVNNSTSNTPGDVMVYVITPTVTGNYKIRTGSGLTASTGEQLRSEVGTFLQIEAIAAPPVLTYPSQILYAVRNGTNQTIPSGNWANRDIVFNQAPVQQGIAYDTTTGLVSLTANTTYLITSSISVNQTDNSYWSYAVFDSANTQLSKSVEQFPVTSGTNITTSQPLTFIYTPTSNVQVKIRTTAESNGPGTTANISQDVMTFMTVQALAAPAVSSPTWTKVSNWNFGGTTTAPTSATGSVREYVWTVVDKMMKIKGYYSASASTGATAGSGEYLIQIPGGYQIDTNITGTASVGNIRAIPLGTLSLDVNNFRILGFPVAYNSGNIKFVAWYTQEGGGTGPGDTPIGSTNFAINGTARYNFFFDAEIPIV